MFDVIKAGLTPFEAEEAYPDNCIVLLFPRNHDNTTVGDIIFVGDDDGAWAFTEPLEPGEGYTFLILQGSNLHIMTPIEVRE